MPVDTMYYAMLIFDCVCVRYVRNCDVIDFHYIIMRAKVQKEMREEKAAEETFFYTSDDVLLFQCMIYA